MKAVLLVMAMCVLAVAGFYPSLGASAYFPPGGGFAAYYHGGVGYAFPEHWDVELGVGYAGWTDEGEDFSIMPVMGTATFHYLPRISPVDLFSGAGVGYAWRHWGAAGDQNSPCGQVYSGINLNLGRVLGIGISGGYMASDLGALDEGGWGLGFNLGVGVPF